MKIVALSDTHNLHRHYGRAPFGVMPDGDVLIHCGDATTHGTLEEFEVFARWFSQQPHRHKIFVPGNHDRCLEGMPSAVVRDQYPGFSYLVDDAVEIEGVLFYGAPHVRRHHDFAFQIDDDEQAERIWRRIPIGVDVLITHSPPFGVLDVGHGEEHIGCPVLATAVENLHPRLHLFGHAHESFGFAWPENLDTDRTVYGNAAVHPWLWKQRGGPRHPLTMEVGA